MAPTRKRSFVLSAQQFSYLEKEAARVGIGISELLRRIIDQHRDDDAADISMPITPSIARRIKANSRLLAKLKPKEK